MMNRLSRIEEIAAAHGSKVIGKIPFDRAVNSALMAGKTVLDYGQQLPGRKSHPRHLAANPARGELTFFNHEKARRTSMVLRAFRG
jgi:nitrogenase subunit NifH